MEITTVLGFQVKKCTALGYKNVQDALFKHVKPKHKQSLIDLKEVQCVPHCTSLWPFEDLSYNEGKAVYISEHGAYHLAMKCQLPIGDEFRDWLAEDVIPSLRKTGQYKIMKEKDDQLTIKEEELEKERTAREKAEKKALNINKFMNNITLKERKLEWIYIATTSQYAAERLFKIGSTERLTKRIIGYNTGRPDTYYYAWVKPCYNCKDVDYHIQRLLKDFKYKDNQELYTGINFPDLKEIIEFVMDNYDKSIDFINDFVKLRLQESLAEDAVIPAPLDIRKITYQIGDYTETIDLETGFDELIKEELFNFLGSIERQYGGKSKAEIHRKELVSHMKHKQGAVLRETNDTDIWVQIKKLVGWKCGKHELKHNSLTYSIKY